MTFTGLLTGLLLTTTASANTMGSLTVDVDAIDSARGGNLVVYVYTDDDNWLKIEKRKHETIVPVTGKSMTVEVSGLPYGEYAVSVIQDLNGNEKIDMDWFPVPQPAEPSGVSNNAEALVGPPSFDDAKFRLNQPKMNLSIELQN